MSQPKKPNPPSRKPTPQQNKTSDKTQNQKRDLSKEITDQIKSLEGGFANYPIAVMVNHAEELGEELKRKKLKTNQIRKFLDAVNRIKVELNQDGIEFEDVKPKIVLLRPKLAYAAARQPDQVELLSDILSVAIKENKTDSKEDFERFVQFLESIVAYHKAAGGK